MITLHCTNCTPKENTVLPDNYQGGVIHSIRGVKLCPRCKCPEVLLEDKSFTTSNGYNQIIKRK